METEWWHDLDKRRGSRPRCVLLVDGTRRAVAARLTDLVGLPEVAVSPNDFWMPRGKPIKTGKGWDKEPVAEARLDRSAEFVAPEVRRKLRDWWLEIVRGANTPNWDLATTCTIGKRRAAPGGSQGPFERVVKRGQAGAPHGERMEKPRADRPGNRAGECRSRARHGATLGAIEGQPLSARQSVRVVLEAGTARGAVVLLYLGFLNAEDMEQDGAPFRSVGDWHVR